MQNIYPLWDIYINISNLNLYPVLFGKGFGSSAIINANIGSYETLTNPHSQIIRLMYDTGIVGLILYCLAFIKPIMFLLERYYTNHKSSFFFLVVLILGACLGQRSNAIFVYFGIIFNLLSRPNLSNEFHA